MYVIRRVKWSQARTFHSSLYNILHRLLPVLSRHVGLWAPSCLLGLWEWNVAVNSHVTPSMLKHFLCHTKNNPFRQLISFSGGHWSCPLASGCCPQLFGYSPKLLGLLLIPKDGSPSYNLLLLKGDRSPWNRWPRSVFLFRPHLSFCVHTYVAHICVSLAHQLAQCQSHSM